MNNQLHQQTIRAIRELEAKGQKETAKYLLLQYLTLEQKQKLNKRKRIK